MKVLMTGHKGYIGSVMAPMFRSAGHAVAGLDNCLFEGCAFGERLADSRAERVDLRDVQGLIWRDLMRSFTWPPCRTTPSGTSTRSVPSTSTIGPRSGWRSLAKEAGVPRFLYSSSCSRVRRGWG